MLKRGFAVFLTFIITLSVLGCGKAVQPVYTIKQAEKEMESTEDPSVEESNPEILSTGVNQFAFQMYDHLDEYKNMIFSPYSLCCALAMLDQAAGGETKTELEEMLGIESLDEWNQQMRNYLCKKWTKETYVLTANSIWMDEKKLWSENIKDKFLVPAGYYYKSELYEQDFTENAEEIVQLVNDWAKSKTKGMVSEIVQKLPPDAAMLLLNAVYFQGKWDVPFEEYNTSEETFHGLMGNKETEMMQQYGEYYAYFNDGIFQGISLPYKDTDIAMRIILPVGKDAKIGELFSSLSSSERKALFSSLQKAEQKRITTLSIPKFTMEQQIDDLDTILKDMGMQSAYTDLADLDSIADDLYVSQVLHKAKIIVDEEGTKAAAVTMIDTCESVCMEEEEIFFIADRPFLYVIEDTETGMILFMGQMNDIEN